MRAPKDSDFPIKVEGVGDFTFARATIGDFMRIRVIANKFSEGIKTDNELIVISMAVARISVLFISGPNKWGNLDSIEGLDKSMMGDLIKIFDALTEQEATFQDGA
ncbi:MAG: hypothetical protein HN842_05265 [Gammaproteobacteria bacterium]|jgi:hypothetical protein|nr:hypothetical protein [Gammaproteobacteria bacterium]MBT7307605.1 hypothetical protein [Gammaproteobacteria bacterium]